MNGEKNTNYSTPHAVDWAHGLLVSVSKALISAKGIQTLVHAIKHACQLALISFNGNDGACKQTFIRNNTI